MHEGPQEFKGQKGINAIEFSIDTAEKRRDSLMEQKERVDKPTKASIEVQIREAERKLAELYAKLEEIKIEEETKQSEIFDKD